MLNKSLCILCTNKNTLINISILRIDFPLKFVTFVN